MKVRIETERLVLRNFKIEDALSMYKNYCSHDIVTKYLTWYPHQNVEETKTYLHSVSLPSIDESNGFELAITLKDNQDDVIGSMSVVNQFEDYIAEIGYVIGDDYWGNGYMSEAFAATIDYLFAHTPITKIRSYHDKDNPASGRVMQKCGLTKVGEAMIQKKFDRDEKTDCWYYELSREDYIKRNQI